ncbi:hypothetical protein LCGC14_1110990 [marine sediment metagenome]|uniref:Uncharacterized protein n=1 Tax=marine sediment metagenome TaxID=412755 RepID=A0A0F9MUM6_9ZZZZ
MTKHEKLTHKKVHEMVQRHTNPDKTKAAANGSTQDGALREMINRARALNTQALNRRTTRTRSR